MALHENLAGLAGLVGTWHGSGKGFYPTIRDFEYADEWIFSDIGKPFLQFAERTWSLDGKLMHVELGYLRVPAPGQVEIVGAIPTGQSELGTGTYELSAEELVVRTDASIVNSPSAKTVERMVRTFVQRGETLTYELEMAAVGVGLTGHLRAELTRG